MGEFQKRIWLPDGSGMNKAERMGGVYYTYLPDCIYDYEPAFSASCVSAIADAQAALAQIDGSRLLNDTEPLARLLLRSEAVSSSRIEGLEMPASKLLEYEELDRLGVAHRIDSTEAQVISNLSALTEALEGVDHHHGTSVSEICEINRVLLQGTRLEEFGGVIRTTQNWVGGNRINPVGAAYVPPAPEDVPGLLEDLAAFVNESELPAVAIAAIVHAQMESIHPYADGNGRTGRALIHLVLKARGLAQSTVPPVSLVLATDKARYITNLQAFRTSDPQARDQAVDCWVEYFARCVGESCRRARSFEETLEGIRGQWRERVSFRANSAGAQLLELLPGTPVLSMKTAQGLTGKSYPSVREAMLKLQDAGIIRQNAKNRKSGIYVADDILQAFNLYERSMATLSGDTSVEKPRRPVPQRL